MLFPQLNNSWIFILLTAISRCFYKKYFWSNEVDIFFKSENIGIKYIT
jgi:hypothetical protein